ncbi:MAG TPA: hypothetical protein VIG38_07365 [Hyphomicrobium sp.]
MSARQDIKGRTFDPPTLVVIGTAFDRAWSEIEHHFGETDAELARSRLAEAVLIVAADHETYDVAALKTEALQVLALTYRSRWPLNWQ